MKLLAGLLAILAIGTIAVPYSAPERSERRFIQLPDRNPGLPFSDGVLAGNTLYLAGRIGIDPQTGLPPEAVDEEIRILLDGFQATLVEAGMTMNHLVQVQVFCPDLTLYDRFNAAYRGRFDQDFPARAFIGSGPLLRGGRFEMLGIAVK